MKIFLFLLLSIYFISYAFANDILKQITLPEGFSIKIYAKVPNARQMAISPNGTLFVGSRAAGKVYAIQDHNNDGYGETITEIASKLRFPTGIAFNNKSLYIGVINKILVIPEIEKNLNSPVIKVIKDDLPNDFHHGWKYLKIGKDNRIYFNIGAPCNVCEVKDPYATIASIKLDGSDFSIFARGVRNSVGFLFHPITNDLWFTDNGRDGLGDDLPPCELNYSDGPGYHFGFPYCFGNNIIDKTLSYKNTCNQFIPTMVDFEAHVAPLGIDISTGNLFSESLNNTIFIAQHGSWNRSKKIGYRIAYAKLNNEHKKIIEKGIFAEGWLKQNGTVLGRPTDILFNQSGDMFISDDLLGNIYIIQYPN